MDDPSLPRDRPRDGDARERRGAEARSPWPVAGRRDHEVVGLGAGVRRSSARASTASDGQRSASPASRRRRAQHPDRTQDLGQRRRGWSGRYSSIAPRVERKREEVLSEQAFAAAAVASATSFAARAARAVPSAIAPTSSRTPLPVTRRGACRGERLLLAVPVVTAPRGNASRSRGQILRPRVEAGRRACRAGRRENPRRRRRDPEARPRSRGPRPTLRRHSVLLPREPQRARPPRIRRAPNRRCGRRRVRLAARRIRTRHPARPNPAARPRSRGRHGRRASSPRGGVLESYALEGNSPTRG